MPLVLLGGTTVRGGPSVTWALALSLNCHVDIVLGHLPDQVKFAVTMPGAEVPGNALGFSVADIMVKVMGCCTDIPSCVTGGGSAAATVTELMHRVDRGGAPPHG